MTKRKENEPDNKARERLNEFNRQRQAIPGEQNEETTSTEKKDTQTDKECEDNPSPGHIKKSIKKSPKK